ncbi:aspartate:alanine exchanger family transporter [Ruegeria meonggei]|uniref:Aspartate/alanine antiporter n=1 Tax=Ruegeria meonggei TaxID=1446476 RepID=A0A1X6YMV6_9RHOB|nr:TrkA C-terminal domain-containing protein [Ruegeria meonggei]SLN25451.1 Aspartate/alanine antiporter [Ruegeria meonggei]
MELIGAIFGTHPELALFCSLAMGYALGKITIGSFTVGSVAGCLLGGVLVGQTGVVVSDDLKQAFFLLFLFSIGYRTGPQFFRSLNFGALPQIAITALLCVVALVVAALLAPLMGLSVGIAAGLLAGGVTESATLGVAIDTFAKTGADPAAQQIFDGEIATGFAVAYFVGVVATIFFHTQLAPRFYGRSLKEACAEHEAELDNNDAPMVSEHRDFEARAYRINPEFAGRTIAEIEARVPPHVRAFFDRVRRGKKILPTTRDMVLETGDIAAIAGLRSYLIDHTSMLGEEVEDPELLDLPVETSDIVVTNKAVVNQTLAELSARPEARTIFLRGIMRSGERLPVFRRVTLHMGDVLTVSGTRSHIEDAAAKLGYLDRETNKTDMVFVAFFILLGGLIGIPALKYGAIELGLGTSVGVLLGGLMAGWLRSVHRTFGFVPEATLWIFDSLGLCVFVACVGITSGPSFVTGVVESGPSLILGSVAIVLLAHGSAVFVGRKVFGINEGVLAGTCCGAGTSAPGLAAVQEAAQSQVPTLGYGLGYAVGNVLLALWGSVIVILLM